MNGVMALSCPSNIVDLPLLMFKIAAFLGNRYHTNVIETFMHVYINISCRSLELKWLKVL